MEKNLGHATAYGYAKSKGYSGTEEEFAELMADYATVGQSAAQSAEQAAASATSASGSAATASQVAQTATSKASEAVTAADTATTKASEASQSASTASTAATSASTSAQTATTAASTATTKASEASESATTATTAKTDAESARDAAAQSASEAAESARTLTIDATLTQSGQAADAKVVGDEITSLKAELNEKINGAFDANYNLFNPNEKITGLLRANNGVVDTTYTAYMASGYIPVTAGDSIRMQYDANGVRKDSGIDNTVAFYSTAFYDSSKVFIPNSGGNGVRVAVVPENSCYFRFSLKNDKYDSITNLAVIDSQDSTILPFMPYGSIGDLKEDKIPGSYDAHINGLIEDAINNHDFKITPGQTTFFNMSKNQIDPTARVTGEYVNQRSGVFETSAGHTRSDYLPVDENTTYVLRIENGSAGFRYFFYDSDKNPIADSGALMPSVNNMLITSPTGAAYIVVSLNTGVSPWMLAKYVNSNTAFESYDSAHIATKYIPDSEIEFFSLPDKVYATAGYELNIYFDNLTENWESYVWEVSCEKGKQFERGYTITPTDSDAGSYTITLRVLTKANYTPLVKKTATLVITASTAGAETSKSLIVLGDSTTNNGTVIVKLHENFDGESMSITTLGTRGTAPYNMEGRAGWALQDYFTRASSGDIQNPFYNPSTQTFDASYYFSETGIARPDWFIVNMGINDMFNMKTDQAAEATAELCISYIEQIITSVKTASPSTKLGICITIPPNHSQDAFGKAYPNRQWRNRYKRNNLILVKKIIEIFSNRESADIFLIPIHTNLDTVYNMGLETLQVNSRNTITYESPILNGGVHPAESGYWQIADVYTAFLKANA